ncbi:phage protein GemA/Gp16 family protein [Leptonema illini]|uniref:Mu-like prophage protein gp16 n=1 Tax=Leptonema illini DSM 21528 TaxID=929563 RepID=H2CKH1_9LEPT|nr:phage protein GemA/Gp16 family protein [Leptonema illini]EHQ08276.1 hypothetical protein Lepil_3619 [Leptonema illini DSM 21528]
MKNDITKGAIKRIWGIAKGGLRMTDDQLYTLVMSATGKSSISDLTEAEGKEVIRRLNDLLQKAKRNQLLKDKSTGVARIDAWRRTEEQDEKLAILIERVNGIYPKLSLDSLSRRMFGKEGSKLNRREAQAVIEALKSMCSRNQIEV